MPGVVRAWKQEPLERLGDEHLTPSRGDGRVELRQKPLRVAVGGDHHVLGLERIERLDPLSLAQVGARFDGSRGQPPHPARRLERAIGRMEHRPVEAAAQGLRQVAAPLDGEAVLAQRLVFGLELQPLPRVGGEAEAAGPPKGVAGQLLEPVEGALGQLPEPPRALVAQQPPGDIVGRRGAAEGEAPVAPAGATCDLARLEHPNARSSLGKAQARRRSR